MITINPALSQFLDFGYICISPLNIDPSCFENSKNLSCIDLLPTNFKPSFIKTTLFEAGISEHISTRESSKTKYYRDYRKFDTDYFSSELSRQLDSTFCSIKENEDCEELFQFSRFHIVFLNMLNIHARLKKKIFRCSNSPFMASTLKKAIMIRSRLKNRFNKTRSDKNWSLYKT